MDYPQLNFLFETILLLTEGLSIGNIKILAMLLLIGGLTYAVTRLLLRRTFSALAYRILFALFLLSTLASFFLAYGLFRAMVPV